MRIVMLNVTAGRAPVANGSNPMSKNRRSLPVLLSSFGV
jgi:hypothetical protein